MTAASVSRFDLPDLGLGRADRRADGADPIGLAGVGRFVAGGDAHLQALQVHRQVGDRLRRRGGAAKRDDNAVAASA